MDHNEYERARRTVAEKKKFYKGLSSYLVMCVFFVVLNTVTFSGSWWFMWPMMGWGIAILMKYFKLFGLPGTEQLGSDDWEEREMYKELSRLRRAENTGRGYQREEEQLELREIRPQRKGWRDDELV